MNEKMNEEKVKPKWLKWHQEYDETIRQLGKKQIGTLTSAINDYAFRFIEPTFKNSVLKAIWPMIRKQIDFDYQKFINGKKGGRPKAGQEQATPVPYEDTQGTLPLNLDEQAQKIINNAPFMQNPTGAPKSSLTETELQSLYQHAFFEARIENPFVAVEKFVHHNEANDWRDSKGRLINNKLAWFKCWYTSDKFKEKRFQVFLQKELKKYWFPVFTVEKNFFKEPNTLLRYYPKRINVYNRLLELCFDKTAYDYIKDKNIFWDYFSTIVPDTIENIRYSELRE